MNNRTSMSSECQTWGLQVVTTIDWLMASELEHENESTAGIAASCNYCGKDQVALLHHSNWKEPLLKPELWLLSTGDLIKHLSNFKALSSKCQCVRHCKNLFIMVLYHIFNGFWRDMLYLCVCCDHSLCICVMCTVLRYTCPYCLGPRCPCIQIDAADLIKPVGLHVECQHCHQAQWEPNVGIGGIDPVDSTASAQSRNQRPLRSKAMILSWDPPPGEKKGR